MEYLQEGEDTTFHAELTRQILMIVDDEDETYARREVKGRFEFSRRPVVCGELVATGGYFSWSESGRGVEAVPGWMERLWASNGGGGTGVFIPRVVAAAAAGKSRRRRRHNKQRKNNVNYGEFKIHG